MKKLSSIILPIILTLTMAITAFAAPVDTSIFTATVDNTYVGRTEASTLIKNLQYKDVPTSNIYREDIMRAGALNMVKGYSTGYSPKGNVTNAEALAFVIRALGLEKDAQNMAVAVKAQAPPNSTLSTQWSIGYLALAQNLGLITPAEYAQAIVADPTSQDPTISFVRTAPVSRERLAQWIYLGLRTIDGTAFDTAETRQSLISYSDFNNTTVDYVTAVEAMASENIMGADPVNSKTFNPKGPVKRELMAKILMDMDKVYFTTMNYSIKYGTVGGIKDAQSKTTGSADLNRSAYIRTTNGKVDIINFSTQTSTSSQNKTKDVPVYKDGVLAGMGALSEEDQIEYIVNNESKEAIYIEVVSKPIKKREVTGYLQEVDTETGTITLKNMDDKTFTYTLKERLYKNDVETKSYVLIDDKKIYINQLPTGGQLKLFLDNDIVNDIKYIGEPEIFTELKGIVTENNADLGYISFIDNNGDEITKYYYDDDLTVEKKQYYDEGDNIGYLDEVFPNFYYDPRDAKITEVEAGDIIFVTPNIENSEQIDKISAATDYTMRYGKIKQLTIGDETSTMLVEYENKQTNWFEFANDIYASKDGKTIGLHDIEVGDWTKLLINEALIGPGEITQSIKEISIEGAEHFITSIVKGQVTGINKVQQKLMIENAQTLTKDGWSNYSNIKPLSINKKDTEYFLDGKQITLDYVNKFLKHDDGEAYIALEKNYKGETIKKITFRTGRDELLNPDTVIDATGSGEFSILTNEGEISTDNGTIVVRQGRLVESTDILAPDFARIALNGGNNAAVVSVTNMPDTSGVQIARGRVLSVNGNTSFTVQSMSLLAGDYWNFTPVQREFSIDNKTFYLDPTGYVKNSTFLNYSTDTSQTVLDKVYNIVIDGSRAAYVVNSPYSTKLVRGKIFEINDATAKLREVTFYDEESAKWLPLSLTNATATLTIPVNSIIVKDNKVVPKTKLEVGDQVKINTDTLPDKMASGINVNGYILQVEN